MKKVFPQEIIDKILIESENLSLAHGLKNSYAIDKILKKFSFEYVIENAPEYVKELYGFYDGPIYLVTIFNQKIYRVGGMDESLYFTLEDTTFPNLIKYVADAIRIDPRKCKNLKYLEVEDGMNNVFKEYLMDIDEIVFNNLTATEKYVKLHFKNHSIEIIRRRGQKTIARIRKRDILDGIKSMNISSSSKSSSSSSSRCGTVQGNGKKCTNKCKTNGKCGKHS